MKLRFRRKRDFVFDLSDFLHMSGLGIEGRIQSGYETTFSNDGDLGAHAARLIRCLRLRGDLLRRNFDHVTVAPEVHPFQ